MENQQQLIEIYLKEILEINKSINLTSITDFRKAKVLHIEDSLSVLEELNNSPEGLYGDLGTGGGFPGVPLAITTNRETLLIDSVGKKLKAIEQAIQNTGIEGNISTKAIRIEDLAKEMPKQFSALTARALSSLPSLIELASPLLKTYGKLICLKAHVDENELSQALSIENKVGMKLVSQRNFFLSDQETYREVLVFEKISEPSIKLPRKVGMAQKKPLS